VDVVVEPHSHTGINFKRKTGFRKITRFFSARRACCLGKLEKGFLPNVISATEKKNVKVVVNVEEFPWWNEEQRRLAREVEEFSLEVTPLAEEVNGGLS